MLKLSITPEQAKKLAVCLVNGNTNKAQDILFDALIAKKKAGWNLVQMETFNENEQACDVLGAVVSSGEVNFSALWRAMGEEKEIPNEVASALLALQGGWGWGLTFGYHHDTNATIPWFKLGKSLLEKIKTI